jgi:ethanolamine ammonia-lyase large subunit
MKLAATLRGTTHGFADLREVLAKANEEKSGDRLAGVAAESAVERVAAKLVLSEVRLEELYEHPALPYDEDAVTRLITDELSRPVYEAVKSWTVADLREHVLDERTSGADLLRLGRGLTSEMIAACAKLMSNLDLIVAAKKIRVVVHANNTLGLPGRLGIRLQPNHPQDSPEGILASLKDGLSYGAGDAVLGINPVTDGVAQTRAILDTTQAFIDEWKVPTQNCCLAHVTTQMKALEQGARLGLMFQSLCGSEKGLTAFGVTIPLLHEAWEMTRKLGQATGPHVMYFETGQGSALSADAHGGPEAPVDQLTLEARNYGLARRFQPFLVNTVVGFIGPEYLYDARQITRAGLEDHFMGKLHGIPMGCDACYTNHADADQNDLENLEVLLTTAGCNFFMGLPMGDDVMLNYQSTSYHDDATLRQLLGLRPAPEFEAWLEEMGLMRDGRLTERAGDPSIFG